MTTFNPTIERIKDGTLPPMTWRLAPRPAIPEDAPTSSLRRLRTTVASGDRRGPPYVCRAGSRSSSPNRTIRTTSASRLTNASWPVGYSAETEFRRPREGSRERLILAVQMDR